MKNIKLIKKAILIVFCIYKLVCYLYADAGETGMNFLKIGIGVRGIAMGEAYTAVADDLGAIYWNPAGLAGIKSFETQFVYNKWFQNIKNQYVSFAVPYTKRTKVDIIKYFGTFALSINYLSIDDIQGYDTRGEKTKVLSASDSSVSLSYANRLYKTLLFGMTLKYLSESLDHINATAYASDLGLLYKTVSGIGMGFSTQNIGTKIKFIEEKGSLPTSYRLGLSYQNIVFSNQFLATTDLTMPSDNDAYVGIGIEYWLKEIIAFRSGYRTGLDVGEGLRAGLGFKTNLFQLDYAFAGFDDLGDTHRFSLTIRFGARVKKDTMSDIYIKGVQYFEEARYSLAIIEFNKILKIEPGNKKALNMLQQSYEKLEKTYEELEVKETPTKKQ